MKVKEPANSNRQPFNVLFVCTGNTARSIMAEAILNRLGGQRFRAFSAGTRPRDAVDPLVVNLLRNLKHSTEGLHPKPWTEFAGGDAPHLDIVILVCDRAADELCPQWEDSPITAEWSLPDPNTFDGTQKEKAALIADIYRMLERRISAMVNLPDDLIDKVSLERQE